MTSLAACCSGRVIFSSYDLVVVNLVSVMSRVTFKLSALDRIHLAGKEELLLLAEFYDVEEYEDMSMEMLIESLEEVKSSFDEDGYRE